MRLCAGVLLLLVACSCHAQDRLSPEIEAIIKKGRQRADVLENIGGDALMSSVLPRQYAVCLYSAAIGAASASDSPAHEYLLHHIDLLRAGGLDPGGIRALLGFGHAMSDAGYAVNAKRPLDLAADDMRPANQYTIAAFTRLECVKSFSRKDLEGPIREAVAKILAK